MYDTITIVSNPKNSVGNYLGPHILFVNEGVLGFLGLGGCEGHQLSALAPPAGQLRSPLWRASGATVT